MSGASFLAPVFFLLSFVASLAHFVLLFGRSFWPWSPYVCISVPWLFVFALFPLILALFCCLRSGFSDIGFLAFASPQVALVSLGGCGSLGGSHRWVVRLCGLTSGFPFLLLPCLSSVPLHLPASPRLPSRDSL